ncbi:MAG TPA: DUF4340 domain-containing protein [Steroidobacteraceae bacterium]|jgi:hypothetical protein
MTSRRLLILGALALIALLAAFLLSNRQAATPASSLPATLYPKLKTQLDGIDAVRIYKAGDARAVELVRKDGNWSVSERDGYGADVAKVHKLLLALSEAKPVEQKTSSPDNYAKLGVEDVSQPAASGVRIELHGQAVPVNLIVGKAGNAPQAMYVRRVGEPASWLINQSLDTANTPDAWLRKEIIDVSADRTQSATVAIAGAKSYDAVKQARTDAGFKVEGVPKGKELSSPAAANGVASALTGLTLADVRPAKDFAAEKPAAHATIKTFDGLVVDADGWVKDGKHYVALKTAYDEALAKRFHIEAAPATPNPTDTGKAGTKQPDIKADATPPPAAAPKPTPAPNVSEAATATNAQLAGWVYEIPEYKYEAIFKPMDGLLKKEEKEKKKQA